MNRFREGLKCAKSSIGMWAASQQCALTRHDADMIGFFTIAKQLAQSVLKSNMGADALCLLYRAILLAALPHTHL